MYLASELGADDILSYGIPHVALATGAAWRRDGIGLTRQRPLEAAGAAPFPPDDFLGDRPGFDNLPARPTVVSVAEGYVMGGALAAPIAQRGRGVERRGRAWGQGGSCRVE